MEVLGQLYLVNRCVSHYLNKPRDCCSVWAPLTGLVSSLYEYGLKAVIVLSKGVLCKEML